MPGEKSIEQLIREDGRHPPEAYEFLQEGLNFAVKQVHGPQAAGGSQKHVTPRQLCLGLRDLAIARWGLLARTVLARWNIRETLDYGNMVQFLVDHGHMKLAEEDSLESFRDVYGFEEAFHVEGEFEMKE